MDFEPEESLAFNHSTDQDIKYNASMTVSTLYKCTTKQATKLCVFDIKNKLNCEDRYDIGCTYTAEQEPEFWFYYTTSPCPNQNYLLNLFVTRKAPGNFSIGISESYRMGPEVTQTQTSLTLSESLNWHSFCSASNNDSHYIKTFCFSKEEFENLDRLILFIPISIQADAKVILSDDVINSIKLQHDMGALLAKTDKSDFVLISSSKREFPVHRIILAAHSPILRDLMKENSESLVVDITDNDMELFLQFIYMGTVKNVLKQDCKQLLNIAKKFEVQALFLLAQHVIGDTVDVDNAVDIAILAKKYKLDDLLSKVCDFIADHPEVTNTKGWKNLDDVELTKYFFVHMHATKVG